MTRAGTGCGGCRILLESMFGQAPDEINRIEPTQIPGATSCVKPGTRVMKSFIIADGQLDSTVFSSNAVPPQLIDCDSTTPIAYALLNSEGQPVLHREEVIKTNQTFVFDTRRENLAHPFYGMFLFALGRSNFGASRFNVAWSNKRSVTSTHENSSTGRPDVVLPILIDQGFLAGSNTVYLAVLNPHNSPLRILFRTFDVLAGDAVEKTLQLKPGGTTWINANLEFYAPALSRFPGRTVALRIHTPEFNLHEAPSVYFFVHHKETDFWSSNHL